MILRIFIAIIALNSSHMSFATDISIQVLGTETDPLTTRRANTAAFTWSVWDVVSSAYAMFTHTTPTPEEILKEKLKGIVFPDGRNAAGELRKHTLPKEAIVNQYDMRVLCTDLEGKIAYTDDTDTYYLAIITLVGCASMGCKDAFSLLAWLFESHHDSHKIKWQYPDRERASWFRNAQQALEGNKTQAEVYAVLQALLQKGSSAQLPEDKKGR